MNSNDPVLEDRILPLIAAPGVLIAALFIWFQNQSGSPSPWWVDVLLLAAGALASVVALSLPLWLIAKFKVLRMSGASRKRAIIGLLAVITTTLVAGVAVHGLNTFTHWLFDGSRFMFILSVLFGVYFFVGIPIQAYFERRARARLNSIGCSRSTALTE